MRLVLAIVWVGMFSGCSPQAEVPFEKVRQAIFKIRTTSQEPDFQRPWQFLSPSASSGTGFYIGAGRIMTNAHVVAFGKSITVQRDGDDEQHAAYVEHIAHDADLAILKTDQTDLFKGVTPLNFGGLPKLRSPVAAVGYPMGGEQLSITEGVVSRTGFRRYSHSGSKDHLLIQVDSAINPGNSGGPAIQGGKVIGVAFQGHTRAENTGYVIPSQVVERFLKDVEDGVYHGHPIDGVMVSNEVMRNPAAQGYYGLDGAKGVQVTHVARYSPMHGWLKKNDILLEIDGFPIGVDGKISYQGERVLFKVIYDQHIVGEGIHFKILRDQKFLEVDVLVSPSGKFPETMAYFGKRPRYLVVGGLIFVSLTRDFLTSWGSKWYMDSPLHVRFVQFFSKHMPVFENSQELIVLAGVLPHPINAYGERLKHEILTTVNGQFISHLEALQETVAKTPEKEDLIFEFLDIELPIVLPKSLLLTEDKGLLQRYQVEPSYDFMGRSEDGAVRNF